MEYLESQVQATYFVSEECIGVRVGLDYSQQSITLCYILGGATECRAGMSPSGLWSFNSTILCGLVACLGGVASDLVHLDLGVSASS